MSVIFRYAPYRLGDGQWDAAAGDAVGDLAVRTLAEYAPNLPSAILHRQVLTPSDLAVQYGLPEGNEYQGELTLDQVLFMRPVAGWGTYRMPLPGLFLCGSGTHPGGGIAGGAGRNAARAVIRDLKTRREA
jgi:phytoene dehydrogenase-like protein